MWYKLCEQGKIHEFEKHFQKNTKLKLRIEYQIRKQSKMNFLRPLIWTKKLESKYF